MDGPTIVAVIAVVFSIIEAIILTVWHVRGKMDGQEKSQNNHDGKLLAMEQRIVAQILALKVDVDRDIEMARERLNAVERRNDEVHEKLFTALGRVTEQQARTSTVLEIYQLGQQSLQREVRKTEGA